MAGLSIKKFLPRTLFGRSLMILITPVVVIQVITVFIFFDRHWSRMTTRLAFAVAGEVTVISEMMGQNAALISNEDIIENAQQYLALNVAFKPKSELPQAQEESPLPLWEEFVARKLKAELSTKLDTDYVVHTDFSNKMIAVYVALNDGLLSVEFPQRRLYSSSGYIFLLWMIGTSIFMLVIAIAFMRNQVRPIRKLAVAAERFGKGRDTPFFKPQGAREVRQAGKSFLDMRRRIERQVSQRTTMLAGVSHDLRTPLTRMKLQIEMLPESADKDGMKEDIADMQRMIDGYLDFVRGDGDEAFEEINLASVFKKLCASFNENKAVFTADVDSALSLTARPLAFERAMNNLLINASKYADQIWVNAFDDGEKIQIEIEDNGPGIDEDFYEEVFKPFTRVDESRNVDTGGVGLGLPIVMDIVHAHGGKIWLERSEHGGLKVVVRMPV